jgi:hypothetical protein
MKINLAWIVDPKDKKPSVALTNLVISIVFLLVVGVLNVMGKIQDTGIVMEYFGISAALYFGRRLSFGNKDYSAESEQSSESNSSEKNP